MKKIIPILLFVLAVPAASTVAQNIALGERAPELKVQAWLEGQQPQEAPMTYVEFFVSSNKAAKPALDRLKAISDKLGAQLHVVIVTREKEAVVSPLLKPYLSKQISVALDPAGKIFTAYGVTYVPFGVLLNAKNRALWMGNSLQISTEIIEQVK